MIVVGGLPVLRYDNYTMLTGKTIMSTPPLRHRVRRTAGSKTLAEYIENNGLRPVSVYMPTAIHKALSQVAIEADISLQALVTLAVNTYYGTHRDLPPLVAPTRIKQDPHKNFTWYADIDMHKRLKLLALDLDCSAQQLILSALIDYTKDHAAVKALKIRTGYPPYARAPLNLVHSAQSPTEKEGKPAASKRTSRPSKS